MEIAKIIAAELGRREVHVQNVHRPALRGQHRALHRRYRKEMHGAMDDTALRTLAERLAYLRNLEARQGELLRAIEGQGTLTEALRAAVENTKTLAEAEDLYRPYKPKRRTRASVARERGLEGLALALLAQTALPEKLAENYVDPEKGVESISDALAGPGTSSRRSSPTTPRCAPRSGPDGRRGELVSLAPAGKTASTGCTMTSGGVCPGSRATRSWPSTGERPRAF
jgi:transcriptional accessory protein Tex/SPT6